MTIRRPGRGIAVTGPPRGRPITVFSLHPTRDVVLDVPRVPLGGVGRAASWLSYPAGKALNAARTAGLLGARVRAVALAPPSWRTSLRRFLGAHRVATRLIPVPGEGRVCVFLNERRRETVINTDLALKPGRAAFAALARMVRLAARREGFVVFSGSPPPSFGPSRLRTLFALAGGGRARLVLDQSGGRLALGIRYRPELIKPNLSEFRQLTGRSLRTRDDVLAAIDGVRRGGVGRVLLSLGERGCWLAGPDGRWFAHPLKPSGPVASPVGSGDALLGGYLAGASQGLADPDSLAWGVAAASANLERRGACLMPASAIRALRSRVRVVRR